jgi:hypothetical protein
MRTLQSPALRRTHDWCPEDYGLYPTESGIAKEVDTLNEVTDFLKDHDLPFSPSWGKARG